MRRGCRLMKKCCPSRRAELVRRSRIGRCGRRWRNSLAGKRSSRKRRKLLKTPLPELTDDLYLDYSRTGNRDRCQEVIFKRQDRASVLALAECFENRGRFLPGIEEAIASICGEKTWVYPAHDGSLRNFKGESNRNRSEFVLHFVEPGHNGLLAGR